MLDQKRRIELCQIAWEAARSESEHTAFASKEEHDANCTNCITATVFENTEFYQSILQNFTGLILAWDFCTVSPENFTKIVQDQLSTIFVLGYRFRMIEEMEDMEAMLNV